MKKIVLWQWKILKNGGKSSVKNENGKFKVIKDKKQTFLLQNENFF